MANTMSDNANKAAWLTEAKQNPLKVDHAPMPTPGADEVVIKNKAVAVNPVDWKIQDSGMFIQSYPNVLGAFFEDFPSRTASHRIECIG